jgi:hypothetical protein
MKVVSLVALCVSTGLITFGVAVLLYNLIPNFELFLVMGLVGTICGGVDTLIIIDAQKKEGV